MFKPARFCLSLFPLAGFRGPGLDEVREAQCAPESRPLGSALGDHQACTGPGTPHVIRQKPWLMDSGLDCLKRLVQLTDVHRSNGVADINLIDVDESRIFDHSTHLCARLLGKPAASQVFGRGTREAGLIPKSLGTKLPRGFQIVWKLFNRSVAEDEISVSWRTCH